MFVLRTIPDSNQIRQWIRDHDAKSACVVGAAWSGLEVAESLHHRGLKVSVLELAPQVMPGMDAEMTVPLRSALVKAGVTLVTGEGIASVTPGVPGVSGLNVATSKGSNIPAGPYTGRLCNTDRVWGRRAA